MSLVIMTEPDVTAVAESSSYASSSITDLVESSTTYFSARFTDRQETDTDLNGRTDHIIELCMSVLKIIPKISDRTGQSCFTSASMSPSDPLRTASKIKYAYTTESTNDSRICDFRANSCSIGQVALLQYSS